MSPPDSDEFNDGNCYDNAMVATIKEIVVVGAGGQIELRATQLPPGSRAEVTVVPLASSAGAPLQALDALQASLALNREAAVKWAARVREERQSFPHRS
jgi:hypothetical protein